MTVSKPEWQRLADAHPWPVAVPDVPPDPQGFFDAENVASLRRALALVPTTAPLILELGTWKGKSAKWMLETYPAARVVCVDSWTPETTYADFGGKWDWLAKTPHLLETCQRNLWAVRDRCLLVKASTVHGMALVDECGLKPDLVYVDASHAYEDVCVDVRGAIHRWPDAVVLGDDYNQAPVRRAVQDVVQASASEWVVADERSVWRLVRARTKWGDYGREYGALDVAGQVVLDAGAEYGTTAQYFLARGARRVLVSELEPGHRARLERAAEADARLQVLPPLSAQNFESWMQAFAPSRVKVDTEGAEASLLEVSQQAFTTPAAYVMETHTPALHAALIQRFESCGYTVRLTREFKRNPNVKVLYAARA